MAIERLILGTVQFGLNYGINNLKGKPPKNEVLKILKSAESSGLKLLDTAPAYGNSETLIGEYFKINSDSSLNVMTKFILDNNRSIKDQFGESLENLQKDSIHTLYYHSFDDYKNNLESINTLLELKSKGIIQNIGISVYSNVELDIVLKNEHISVIQLPFNLLDNDFQRGALLRKAKSLNKTIVVRSIFLQGLFFKEYNSLPQNLNVFRKDLKKLNTLRSRYQLDWETLCINYALSKDYIDYVLIGVDSEEQFRRNISALDNNIEMDLLYEIDKIDFENKSLLNPSNW